MLLTTHSSYLGLKLFMATNCMAALKQASGQDYLVYNNNFVIYIEIF
jgi:hypothetical protein